jgi:cobalt/nickel transport system permease protein
MHMADALLSPAVGGVMWAASAGAIAFSSAKLARESDDRKVPLMGVLGAFLFAAQMINFSIPGTGSSGHLGGGLLLAVLLGPHAALLTIASVLVVQALFFADGGLLALGCNIFNMAIIPAFLVYPLIYRRIIGSQPGRARVTAVTMLCAVIGLQMGAFSVVLESVCSGISSLPFSNFLVLMQPIHLAIGLVEGAVTAAIIGFLREARPGMLTFSAEPGGEGAWASGKAAMTFLVCALLTAGVLSWYACQDPDGLEWAVAKVTGQTELPGAQAGMHRALSRLQETTAFFPDYGFKASGTAATSAGVPVKAVAGAKAGTGIAGVAGTLMTLVLVFVPAFLIRKLKATGR